MLQAYRRDRLSGLLSNYVRAAFGSQAYRRDRSVNQTVGISAQSVIGFGGLGWQYSASKSFLIDFVSPYTA